MTASAKTEIPSDTYLTGVGVSPGISIGQTFLLERRTVATEHPIASDEVATETERFRAALATARLQLQQVRDKASRQPELREHLYILDAHLMMLDDEMLVQGTLCHIRENLINAEGALKRTLGQFREVFESIADDYLRERVSDVDAVGARVLRALIGQEEKTPADNLAHKAVIVAHDLSPADTMQIDKLKTVGFVIDCGGRTSHTAILARSLGIPAVVGLEHISEIAAGGVPIIVDGNAGTVVLNPSDQTFREYLKKKQVYEYLENELRAFYGLPAETRDGHRLTLRGNVELASEVELAKGYGAEGVGLFRTEFLYMNRQQLPTEDEQFHAYREIVERMAPQPVTIRTLDLGGDKFLPGMRLEGEANPAMGLRAVRLSLKEPEMFKEQLRAILRVSAFGKVRLMFPMITGVAEVRACRNLLRQAMDELAVEGVAFDRQVELGVMIETPAAVLVAPLLAKEVDFFSVGTNDLIQYCLAVDRGNEHVAYLYQPTHPAVLRALKSVCDAARKEGIGVAMCGEMASEPLYSLVLLGLGFDELSMNPPSIARIKQVLRQVAKRDGEKLVEELFRLSTAAEVAARIETEMVARFPDIFGAAGSHWIH